MKEELQIKIKVDTSNVTTTLNKLKNEVSNVEKSMNGTAASSSTTTKNTQANVQATNKLSKALGDVKNSIQKIKNMDIFDFAGLAAAEASIKGIAKHIERMKKNATNNLMDAVQGVITGMGSRYGTDEGMNEKELATMLKIQEIEKQLGKEDLGLKGLKNIRKEMKALGISTKGTTLGVKGFGAALGSVAIVAGTVIAALVALAGVAVVIGGIIASFKVSKLGDEIYHNAKRFNMGTEAFQEWSYIMEMAGGTVEDLTGFMETLASEQAAVIEGSEDAAANFKRLGLSMEEVSGMKQQELFEETVRRIQQIGDATERSAIAYSIFGDEASKFMNVLNMTNQEMDKAIQNYHLLGGAMSGELLESSNSLQGSIHNMKQAWQGISNTLAEAFIPIVQAVVRWLTKAFVVINLFLRSIFQLDLKSTGAGDAMDGATSSTNKYTGAAKSATKAAEELRRVTMGFDELNIVSNPKSSSADTSSGGGAGFNTGGMDGGIDTSLLDASSLNLEGFYAWFDKYKTLIKDITAWSLTLIGIIGGVLAICFGQVPLGIALLAMGGIGILAGLGEGGTWDRLFAKLKKLWDSMAPAFQPVAEFFSTIWQVISDMAKVAWDAISGAASDAWALIEDVWKHVQPFFKVLVEGIKQYWYDFQMKLEIIWAVVSESVLVVVNVIAAAWKLCWTAIKAVWDVVIGYFKAIWETIKGIFSVVKDVLTGNFKGAWEGIKGIVGTWVNYFKTIWNSIKSIFSGVKTFFGDIFKAAFNGVIGIVEKAINAIIKRANKLSWDIPEWVPVIGGGKFGFNFKTISIPRLATGGIATASTIANIGEAGREAILPLDNNTQWMDALADKIAERNSAPSKIVLQVGEKELGWASINGINSITKQTGSIQLAL